MKEEREYLQDLAEIRSMMERSSKFLSLSGLAGVMAGLYALAGVYIAYTRWGFNPGAPALSPDGAGPLLQKVSLLAVAVLILAVGTAVLLSRRKAALRGESAWNAPSRKMIAAMAPSLVAGGLVLGALLVRGMAGLLAPLSLIFYGLSLYAASRYTFGELKYLGLIQVGLGLAGIWFPAWGLLLWALGFGAAHILYGIHMHLKYER